MVEQSASSSDAEPKISSELADIMRKSLKKERWDPIDLGEPASYTTEAVNERWAKHR